MRSYWLKIVLSSCAIFAVGYVGVFFIRKSVHRFERLTESSDPVSIPLAFLPFTLDGAKAGTFKLVRIERDAPKSLTRITIRVALSGPADATRIQACLVTIAGNGHEFDPSRGFRCVKPETADSALVPFGQVTFTSPHAADFSVPMVLDSALVADMRTWGDEEIGATVGAEAEARAAAAEQRADSITRAGTRRVDSIVKNAVPPQPKPRSATPRPG